MAALYSPSLSLYIEHLNGRQPSLQRKTERINKTTFPPCRTPTNWGRHSALLWRESQATPSRDLCFHQKNYYRHPSSDPSVGLL